MFGFVTANIVDLSDEEKERYQAMYCGLCHALRVRHGNLARFALSYDLTFLIMLLGSLYEPAESRSEARCPAHPLKAQPTIATDHSLYAADMAVALAYYKCLDDWNDEGKSTARYMNRILERSYRAVREMWQRQCEAIDAGMAAVAAAERDPNVGPDEAGRRFGEIMGEIFVYDANDFWAPSLWRLGAELGCFIYFMDAAVDLDDDIAHDTYNPFKRLDLDAETIRLLLQDLAGRAAETFETLPLERDLHTMRSVIYAGVWQQFYAKYGDGANAGEPDGSAKAGESPVPDGSVRSAGEPSAKEDS